jgi:hypothetical protein
VALNNDNWSPFMRGDTGARPRHICRPCWSSRQRKYQAKKDPQELRLARNHARKTRENNWSDDRKDAERRKRYDGWLKRKYGISIEIYDSLYESQKGMCNICHTTKPRGKGGFHVDHCHSSGSIRSLLCAECNMMLGLAKDNVDILKKAIAYLSAHNPDTP